MVECAVKGEFHITGPEASVPAVEICSERSAAGMTISAWLTL